jgi:hypothetical protein
MRILRSEQQAEWLEALDRCPQHDFYHLPGYHALAERHGEGTARLFIHEEGEHLIAVPLLLRPLRSVPGLARAPAAWQDATSVYGYAGPVASSRKTPARIVRSFQVALTRALRKEQVVSVFSRLHPLLSQAPLLAGLGSCRQTARTVAIDLTLPPRVQRAHYRKSHKWGINRLRHLGVSGRHDHEFRHLDTFVDIYHETMRRVGAASYFYFPHSYFRELVAEGTPHVHLFVCLLEDQVICAGLFLDRAGIVQCHLSGTRDASLDLAPSKLLVDEVRLWAHARGRRMLHLGGGTTNRADDSLLQFKTGFADRTHSFLTWRWVVDSAAYAELVNLSAQWNEHQGLSPSAVDYFPKYRAPTEPARADVS